MTAIKLSDPVDSLAGVGPRYSKYLKKLDINTIEDLLYHFPHRHIDYSLVSPINQVQAGETVTIRGEITQFSGRYLSQGRSLQRAVVSDKTGSIIVTWFNQPYLSRVLKKGTTVNLSGKIKTFAGQLSLTSPEWEISTTSSLHTGRLVSLYPLTTGLSSKWLRRQVKKALEATQGQISEFLPRFLLTQENLLNEYEAIKKIHFPENKFALKKAKERLAFDEIFLPQLAAALRKKAWKKEKTAFPLLLPAAKLDTFTKNLSFSLTQAQKKAVKEILADMKKTTPMNRLLEGDVGSGKTVVAAVAALAAIANKKKVFLMAPTQILAQQHYQTFLSLFPKGTKIKLVVSGQNNFSSNGEIFIGTHALLYQKRLPDDLALVIIDEQHRFGVRQRAQLIKKTPRPHLLTMTATPIPRTVALTLYGDLDFSFLDEMPPGRKKIITRLFLPQERSQAYQFLIQKIKKTACQAYIVCPLIEESDKEHFKNIRAAKSEYETLKKEFPKLRFALLHGRLKGEEKEKIMKKFQKGKIDVLVTTPVVEVGMDVKNATLILIEGAERFGLAQLHQLRGRVGRGEKQSYCLLLPSRETEKSALKRLAFCQKEDNGLKLAEIDLRQRGPGEIYGLAQHGFLKMKLAQLTDYQLIKRARQAAEKLAPQINKFPSLKKRLKKYTIEFVEPN